MKNFSICSRERKYFIKLNFLNVGFYLKFVYKTTQIL